MLACILTQSASWGLPTKRFVEDEDRSQSALFPERLDDYICEDNLVRVVEAFVDELDLRTLGFDGVEPNRTPEASRLRRQTVEHPFGTLKAWMGSTHFATAREAIG